MAVLPILTYPDPRLRLEAAPVADFAEPSFQGLVDDLIDTMNHAPWCVGVAAPQVGESVQLLVIDCDRSRKKIPLHHGLLVVVNPAILAWQGMAIAREGCLSLPQYTGNVARAVDMNVQFQDRHGVTQTMDMADFEARVLQHEMDHLEGKLFVDRVVSRRSDLFPRRH
ncbi:MAG: peptide deformylase [Magnetococcales bacterium]|nr:peptide deformylase [Magnetococcales bacterium]